MRRIFIHTWWFESPWRSWLAILVSLGCLAATAPLTPAAAEWLKANSLLHVAMVILFLAPLAYILLYFIYEVRVLRIKAYLILLFIVLAAMALTAADRTTQEHIHVLVYAFLAVILYKTFIFYFQGLAAYALPLIAAVLIGVADETWQSMIPTRVFDFRDVSDNAVGALVGIMFVFIRNRYGLPND